MLLLFIKGKQLFLQLTDYIGHGHDSVPSLPGARAMSSKTPGYDLEADVPLTSATDVDACAFAFGCLSASLLMEKMKNKTSRLSALMVPATPFEKFFSRWLVSTIVFLVVFLIAFKLADYTRVSIYSLIYPDAKGAILPVNLGYLVGSGKRWFLFNETYELIFVLSIYCFIQSLFVLGSSVWPKNSFLKTFVAVTIIVLIYVVVGIAVGNMLFNGSHNRDCSYIFSSITEQQAFNLASIAFVLFALVNCTLAYFRFKESEIIQRM